MPHGWEAICDQACANRSTHFVSALKLSSMSLDVSGFVTLLLRRNLFVVAGFEILHRCNDPSCSRFGAETLLRSLGDSTSSRTSSTSAVRGCLPRQGRIAGTLCARTSKGARRDERASAHPCAILSCSRQIARALEGLPGANRVTCSGSDITRKSLPPSRAKVISGRELEIWPTEPSRGKSHGRK